jgi:UDP-2-acetamido-3-amino-2,3-dideoxy-glucuronate N-acetyltransferase
VSQLDSFEPADNDTTMTDQHDEPFVHPAANVERDVHLGARTRVWALAQIRAGARLGRDCVIGRNVFVDVDVTLGDCVKVQNNANLYEGVELGDGVFVGPAVVFTNDRVPRAITPTGRLKETTDWELGRTRVGYGASIGAGAIIVTGVTIGRWAMVAAGAVVTADVPDHGLVAGVPARLIGYVDATGRRCDEPPRAEPSSPLAPVTGSVA